MRKIANYKRNNNNKNKYKEKILKAKSITALQTPIKENNTFYCSSQPSIHSTSTSNSSFYFSMNKRSSSHYLISSISHHMNVI